MATEPARRALITGAGAPGGIGMACARALGAAGFDLALAATTGRIEARRAELLAEGFRVTAHQGDLTDPADVARLYDQVGPVDVLVNNAGGVGSTSAFEDLDDKTRRWEIALNIDGVVNCTQAVAKDMLLRGTGSIINISSIQGVTAPHFPYYEEGQSSPAGYTFEKWGLVGFTKWLAAMYGKDGIRANAISPGGYDPGLAEKRPLFYETYARHTPLGKWPERDDIKGPACFLASDAARYVTGHNLVMDGGFTIW